MKLGKRTAKLLGEAMVLGFVEGSHWGQANPRQLGDDDRFPKDAEIVFRVLAASTSFRDLYPTLSKLDEAKAADAERRRESMEQIKQLMAQRAEQNGER